MVGRRLKASLSQRITIAVLFVTLVPLVITTYSFARSTRQTLIEDTLAQLGEITHAEALLLQQFVDARQQELVIMAQSQELQGKDPVAAQRFLHKVAEQNPLYESILLVDGSGVAIAESGTGGSDDYSQSACFLQALQGTAGLGDMTISQRTGSPVITAATPITGDGGLPVAVLIGSIRTARLREFLNGNIKGKTGKAFLVNRDLYFLTPPDNDPRLLLREQLSNGIVDNLRVGQEMAAVYQDHLQTTVVGAYTIVLPQLGWGLVVEQDLEEVLTLNQSLSRSLWLSTLGIGLAVGLFAFVYLRRVTSPLKALLSAAEQIAAGDLTVIAAIKTDDEVGRLAMVFNQMSMSLRSVVSGICLLTQNVSELASNLNLATKESQLAAQCVSAAAAEIAHGVGEQAQLTAEAAASTRQIASQTDQSSAELTKLRTASTKLRQLAANGMAAMTTQADKAGQVADVNSRMVTVIEKLSDQATSVGHILATITEIADQTHMLALNASIEAARAGEQGSGFAVVAEQVGSLAQESTTAVASVSETVAAIRVQAKAAARELVDSKLSFVAQTASLLESTEAITAVTQAVESMDENVERIAESSQAIDQDADLVAASTRSASLISEQHAALTEELAASSEEQAAAATDMAALSAQLMQLVSELAAQVSHFRL